MFLTKLLMRNSVGPDQTAPWGAVWSGPTLCLRTKYFTKQRHKKIGQKELKKVFEILVVYRDLQKGYIPDTINILEKYELKNYFDDYIKKKKNNFPSKSSWKRLVRCIQEKEVCAWLNRTSAPECDRFRRLHTDYRSHSLWISSKENPHVLSQSISCIQMIARTVDNVLSPLSCLRCNCNYNNIVDHCIHDCSFVAQERLNLWYEKKNSSKYRYFLIFEKDKIFLT